MEAIEVICSNTEQIEVVDKNEKRYIYEVPIWNPTVANLTLMALGSSAPEILLSVIETVTSLGSESPGELGVFSIVGSAAFNLLVISGVSILCVDEIKPIYDLGVFAITALFSLFAYIWMYLALEDGIVDVTEAWLTLSFFFILVILAYMADRCKAKYEDRKKSDKEIEEKDKLDELKIKKSHLRNLAKEHGEVSIIGIARGIITTGSHIPDSDVKDIRAFFKELIGTDNLNNCEAAELLAVLQPDTLLERFAAKKANNLNNAKDFLSLKGQKGQLENKGTHGLDDVNEMIGFKCLHYSVTESAGHVVITVIKKSSSVEYTFGVRTIAGTAMIGKDYIPIP